MNEKQKQKKLKPIDSDPCIYLSKDGKNITLVAIYVDDLIVPTNDKSKYYELKTELAKSYEIKDLGLNLCLGIEIQQDSDPKKLRCLSKGMCRPFLSGLK